MVVTVDKISKAQSVKEIICYTLLKLNTCHSAKDNVKRIIRQAMYWGKIFPKDQSDNGLSKIYMNT